MSAFANASELRGAIEGMFSFKVVAISGVQCQTVRRKSKLTQVQSDVLGTVIRLVTEWKGRAGKRGLAHGRGWISQIVY